MTTLDIRNYADVEITSLYQWDEHRTIRIHGITIAGNVVYKLHFSNRRSFVSLVVVPTEDEGVFVAEIPIQMLQRPCAIAVYLYGENTESNERMTLGEATITVVPRAMPEDEVEQHEDRLLAVPDGFVMKDGKLYLARGGIEFGEGATVGGGGGDRVSVYDAMSGTQVAVGYEGIAQRLHQDVNLMAFSWEQGTGNPSTGTLDTSDNYRIRCPEYIDIPQDYSGSMTVNAAVEGASTVYWTPYFYNSGKSFYGGQLWFECGTTFEIPPAYAAYTRIILCVSPSRATTITPEQLQACTAVFY